MPAVAALLPIAARVAPMVARGGTAAGGRAGASPAATGAAKGGGGGGMPGNPISTVQSVPGISAAKKMFGDAMGAGQVAESRVANVAGYLNPSQFG